MSNTDVAIRFEEVMAERDNYQSVSLPLVLESSECIFIYYASSSPEGFVFNELVTVALRDLETSIISIKEPTDFFHPDELKSLTMHETVRGVAGQDALALVNKYYSLHEQILDHGINEVDQDLLLDYFETFCQIIPKSNLRKVYFRIGKALFECIAHRTGKQLDL